MTIEERIEEFWERWMWGSVYYAGAEIGIVTIAGRKEAMTADLHALVKDAVRGMQPVGEIVYGEGQHWRCPKCHAGPFVIKTSQPPEGGSHGEDD